MTGKDLIIYILMNNLEDKPIFQNGKFLDFLTENEAALKFNVGINTVKIWYELGFINGIKIGDKIYIPPNVKPPKEITNEDVFNKAVISIANKNIRKD